MSNPHIGTLAKRMLADPDYRTSTGHRWGNGGEHQRGRIAVPTSGHPAVRRLFSEMRRSKTHLTEVSGRSGVARRTIQQWRVGCVPNVANLEAALNVLGYRLAVVPMGDGE